MSGLCAVEEGKTERTMSLNIGNDMLSETVMKRCNMSARDSRSHLRDSNRKTRGKSQSYIQTDVQHRFHASEEVKDSSFAVVVEVIR